MAIDEAGHDPLSRSVDHLHVVAGALRDVPRKRSNAFDAVGLDDDGLIGAGRSPRAVYQGTVPDDEYFLLRATHIDLLYKRTASV